MADKQRRHGTGHLYKRHATWWLAYHAKGVLVRESARTPVRKEAEELLRSRLSSVDAGTLTARAGRTTFADLERVALADLEANDRRSSRNAIASFAHMRGYFGEHSKARDITTAAVEAYKGKRLEAGAARATVNRELACLRRAFRLAQRQGLVAVRPDFSLLALHNARKGFVDQEQLDALVKHLPEWFAPVARFGYLTGWRAGEMLSLQWANVDRKRRVIRIEHTKNEEPRTLPYGQLPELATVIDEQWRRHEELLTQGRICPFVFQRSGYRIHEYGQAWAEACRAAGIPGRLLHDLRRSAVRNLERAGVPRSVAMKISGHKTESIYKRYAIVAERDIAEGLARLAASR